MFTIHQRTRRRICHAGFCVLCAMPTTGLLAWTANLKTATHLAQCQQELSERLGLTARFERVRYPQPGQSLYEGFELADPETGEWVLRCRSLDVMRNGRKLVLAPGDLEVAAQRAEKLVRLVMRRLSHELPGDDAIWLVPTQVTLEAAASSQTYNDVDGRVDSQDEAETATLRFRMPEPQPGEPLLVSMVRRHTKSGVSTTVKLDTLGAVLPISIFSPWLHLEQALGGDAEFCGSLTVAETQGRCSAQMEGLLTNVDLERLVARQFPHHITGRAAVEIKQARVEAGRLVEAVGLLRCESGTIGGSLLMAAVEQLGCQPGPSPPGRMPFNVGKNHVYRDLAIDFAVDEQGVLLESPADAQPAGALVLNDGGKVLVGAPSDGPVPLIQFVRALVPDSDLQVPATKETARLVPWLPLPPAVRSPEKEPSAPPLRIDE